MMFPDDLYRNQRTVSAHSSIVSRRAFLTLAASGLAVAERLSTYLTAAPIASAGHNQPITTDVDWLEEVQRRPENLPAGVPRLRPLLIQPDGAPIKTLTAWQAERARLRKSWLDLLGPMPDERPPIKLQMLGEDRPDGCIRQLVRYESEPGLPVEGYLLRPHLRRDRRPGVVALHGTSKDNIQEIAGVIGPPQRHLGLKLAQRGFVVFCPRCFLWQNAATYEEAVATFKQRHPQALGMRKMLWDAMRAVDVLMNLTEDVDPQSIGATGHSLGAKETLYLAAFDDRIRAAVASEGGLGLTATNWDAPWYLGSAIHAADFPLNHHELLALIAPRPLLILGGESGNGAADGDRSWPYVEAALAVYRLYGGRPRLGLHNHREGHTLSDASFDRLAEWLQHYL